MIDAALSFLARGEWYAVIGAVLIGTFITEMVKRTARRFIAATSPWVYPWVGFIITAVSAYSVWPLDGLFPHPIFMAVLLGATAPTLYKLTTTTLRRFGLGWVADALTGEAHSSTEGPNNAK